MMALDLKAQFRSTMCLCVCQMTFACCMQKTYTARTHKNSKTTIEHNTENMVPIWLNYSKLAQHPRYRIQSANNNSNSNINNENLTEEYTQTIASKHTNR